MKNILRVTVAFLAAGVAATAQAQTISEPEDRDAFIDRSGRLEAIPVGDAMERFTDTINPFSPDAPMLLDPEAAEAAEEEARRAAGPSDREVLEALADRVRPSGVMTIGGERILLFGERRVRAGDHLQLNYRGQTYRVTVGAIGLRSYLLQLGEEEISKPVQ